MGGTLVTIAKDVKIQVEFNPAVVSNYRLVGYENRALKKEDFADDKKDAGEIGAAHTVTALYEVVLVGSMSKTVDAEPLRYSNNALQVQTADPVSLQKEMLTVKLRYKEPAGDVSKLLEFPLIDTQKKLDAASRDFQFASAVAEFAELLRGSKHSQAGSWESLIARANDSRGEDRGGYRAEFVVLARKAEALIRRSDS
jgi:Ca-activated chloride channel family protein